MTRARALLIGLILAAALLSGRYGIVHAALHGDGRDVRDSPG